MGAQIFHPSIHLFPGAYSSRTSTDLAALLPKTTFTTPKLGDDIDESDLEGPRIVFGNTFLQALKGSSVDLSTDGSGEWEIVVNQRPDVQWFDQTKYRDMIGSTHLDAAFMVKGNNSVAHFDTASGHTADTSKKWSSLLLPAGAYIQFSDRSRPASTSSAPRSLLIRGSIANREALSRDVVDQGWNMALGSSDWTLGSGEWCPTLHQRLLRLHAVDACLPACSATGGTCLPSPSSDNRTVSSTFSCRCAKGFSGPTCSTCEPGYFGPACQPCPRQCFDEKTGIGRCDDGVTGSGGCRGVIGNSESCEYILRYGRGMKSE